MGIDRHYRRRTRTAGIGTVVGITLVLVMLGFQGFILLNAKALETYFKEQVQVDIYMKRELKEVDMMQFRKELDTEAFTRETRQVTAEEAAERLSEDLGEDFLGVLGANPLLASVELHVRADHAAPDSLRWIVEHLERDPRVHEVAYNAAVVENIEANMVKLNLGGLVLLALLLFVAIALINNTIRLAIYSKRFLIRTMHLVGATPWFIKRPFLAQGFWQGVAAAVLAVGVMVGLMRLGLHYVPDLLSFTDTTSMIVLFAGVLLLGLLISMASTWFAVGRYLRMNSEELHWS